jgi:hypothetical protein
MVFSGLSPDGKLVEIAEVADHPFMVGSQFHPEFLSRPMQLTTLSQSSLQDYVDCPRRFQLRYLERLSYPAVESEPALENEKHIQEGEYFHRLAQQYFIGIPNEQIGRLANTPNLQRWWDNFLNAKDLTGFYKPVRSLP